MAAPAEHDRVDPSPLEPAEPPRRRGPGRPRKVEVAQVELKSVESAWQGLWQVLRLLLSLAGYESDVRALPVEEAREDAKALLPVVQRHPGIARILGWIGAPVVIVQRVMQHFKPKPRPGAAKSPLGAKPAA